MKKYLIKEVAPEDTHFEWYFEDDGITSASGDFLNNLFIVYNEGWGRVSGFNMNEYEGIKKQAEGIINGFDDVENWEGGYNTYKEVIEDYNIKYSPRKCHALKEWVKSGSADPESIADFLTITTGHMWECVGVCGYSQGDYVQVIFCTEKYTDKKARAYGEIYLGCGKEFYVADLDDNGEEIDTCYGYIVADCQAWKDDEYKKLVCEWAGIPEDEAELQMIENCYTSTHYTYRTA